MGVEAGVDTVCQCVVMAVCPLQERRDLAAEMQERRRRERELLKASLLPEMGKSNLGGGGGGGVKRDPALYNFSQCDDVV